VGSVELLVVFDKDSAASAVFDRLHGGQTLTFAATGSSLTTRDEETGSTWDLLSGTATDGPLSGEQLGRLKSTVSFWFGWKDFHSETVVYGTGG